MTERKRKAITERVEQNDPHGAKLKSIKTDLLCGGMHQISVFRPSVIIDAHMHIQSGNCAPVQIIWDRISVLGKAEPSRGVVEVVGRGIYATVDLVMKKHVNATINKIRNKKNEDGEYYRKHGKRKMIPEAKKKTLQIGDHYIAKRNQVFEHLRKQWDYRGLCHLVLTGVVMTMDMEYAHVNGYFGLKIYNPVYADSDSTKKPIDYWYPIPGRWQLKGNTYELEDGKPDHVPEEGQTQQKYEKFWKEVAEHEGIPGCYHDIRSGREKRVRIIARPCLVGKKETDRYEQWKQQIDDTELAVLKYPLKMLPLFHYDPRRWQLQLKGNQEVYDKVGSNGLYLGIKIYTAQGYRPWDVRRLPILKDFYAECSKNQTPIMNHCTPEGAYTFERDKYFDFVHPNDNDEDMKEKHSKPRKLGSTNHQYVPMFDPGKKKIYFNEHFVSPDAWRKVLNATANGRPLKDLRLCLAHFGGNTDLGKVWGKQVIKLMKDYPNVYADISSSFTNAKFRSYFVEEILKKDPDRELIKDRILFGTDWYLTLLGSVNYVEYCEKARDALKFDSSLWFRFTQYNPCRFYRLDEQIERIVNNVIMKRSSEEMKEILKPLSQKDKAAIYKEAYHIMKSSSPYYTHKETRWIG